MKGRPGRGNRPQPAGRDELDLFAEAGVSPSPTPRDYHRRGGSRGAVPRLSVAEPPIPGSEPAAAVAVATVVHIAKDLLEGAFTPLWVRGEVTDFKAHRNGHWYFCLRDDAAQIRCVVWSRDQRRIPAPPDDGMQVVALGQPTVYAARGDLQFAVTALEGIGDGLRRRALERTHARLAADGLFAPERKRPIPRYPSRVAVVTSPDGAALRDVIAVIRRRCPIVEVVVIAAKVQGEGAPEELAAAIDRVSRWRGADTLIVGRGGGAHDDLWAFNDERVARALATSAVPTISAVGHEIDVTLCDLVADLRAATPSAAAEAAVPVLAELRVRLDALRGELQGALVRRAARSRQRLGAGTRGLVQAAGRLTGRKRAALATASARLHSLSPLATLARGYAIARDTRGVTLGSVADFALDMPFEVLLRDGAIPAIVRDGALEP